MYCLMNLINGTLYWLKPLDIFISNMCTLDSVTKGAFIGGVTYRQPGAISLAQNRVLIQDDMEIIQKRQILTPVLSHKQ